MTHRVSTTISTADPVAVAHRAGIPPVDRAGSGQRAAVSTRAIGAVRRTGRIPVYAVAVTGPATPRRPDAGPGATPRHSSAAAAPASCRSP